MKNTSGNIPGLWKFQEARSVQTKLINLSLFYIKSNKINKLAFIYRSRFLDTWKLFDVRGITELLVKLIQIFTYSKSYLKKHST